MGAPDQTSPVPVGYPYQQPGYPYPYPPQQAPDPLRKRRTGLTIGIVAAVVVVLLGGAAAVALTVGRNWLHPVGGATPPGSARKNVPVASPEQYQNALDEVDQDLEPLYAAMVAARHPDDLQTTAFALANRVTTRTGALAEVGPPTPVAAAHQHLIEGLNAFGSEVTSVASTKLGSICAGPSALSYLSRSTGADKLRAAVAELATADPARAYKVGAFVPQATADPNRSLRNGATIKSSTSTAPNRMIIKNPTSLDVVASVAPTGTRTALAIFYVSAGQDATYIGIPNGNYDLYFTRGQDWDTASTAFTRQCAYYEEPKTFDFATTSTTYTVWTVTVSADPFWKASPTAFPL